MLIYEMQAPNNREAEGVVVVEGLIEIGSEKKRQNGREGVPMGAWDVMSYKVS